MQQFHFDPRDQENKPWVRSSTSTSGKPKRILSSVYRKMYNLHVENKKTKKTKTTTWLQKNGKQLLFIMKKYTIYKWKHQQKHYTDHSLVFRQAEKKEKENRKTLFLTTKSKTLTSRLKKKKKEKQRNPLKRAVIKKKKKLKPHMAIG